MKRAISIVLIATALCSAESAGQIGGHAGAFARMGFGARGMGMANAMTAVTTGDVFSYYNPALLPFSEYRVGVAALGVLSLDRRLNFLGYTQPLPPSAGISAGIINAGVTEIDGRDADGNATGPLRTSENEIYLGFGTKFKAGFSIGLTLKLLYYQLYTDVSSTTAGADIGFLYPLNDRLTIGATIRDLESRYKWDSSKLYGSMNGVSTTDDWPTLYTLGASYKLPDSLGIVSADFEFSSVKTVIFRAGAEVPIIPEIVVRAGVDRVDLKDKGNGLKPAFGLTIRKALDGFVPALNYAYIFEPFSPTGMHIISLSASF
jgi:hypothetical protein